MIHVYRVNRDDGSATETDPIELPSDTADGAAAQDELPRASGVNAWPEGLAVTPDGKYLVVALGQADQAAIIDLGSGDATLADVGRYPYGVAVDPDGKRAYVTNERDGTVSVIAILRRPLGGDDPGRRPRPGRLPAPRGPGHRPDPGAPLCRGNRPGRDLGDQHEVAEADPHDRRHAAPTPRSAAPRSTSRWLPTDGPSTSADAGEDAVVAIALKNRPTARRSQVTAGRTPSRARSSGSAATARGSPGRCRPHASGQRHPSGLGSRPARSSASGSGS